MIFLFQWILVFCCFNPYQDEPGERAVSFEIVNAGITVDGYFRESAFALQFDPKNLAGSSLEGKVRVATIHTGIALRDRHLLGRQYFRAETYPEITMRSKSISNRGRDDYLGIFEVKIKDTVKELRVPFRMEKQGQKTHYKARFTFNRLDFGLGEESLVLGNEVTVILDVPASKK